MRRVGQSHLSSRQTCGFMTRPGNTSPRPMPISATRISICGRLKGSKTSKTLPVEGCREPFERPALPLGVFASPGLQQAELPPLHAGRDNQFSLLRSTPNAHVPSHRLSRPRRLIETRPYTRRSTRSFACSPTREPTSLHRSCDGRTHHRRSRRARTSGAWLPLGVDPPTLAVRASHAG